MFALLATNILLVVFTIHYSYKKKKKQKFINNSWYIILMCSNVKIGRACKYAIYTYLSLVAVCTIL